MLSPFPGMDPFLEAPSLWTSVHARLINAISDQLAERLAPHFFVEIEQRVYITDAESHDRIMRTVIPDLYVLTGRNPAQPAVMTDTYTEPTLVEPVYDPEVRERYIEIRDVRHRELVSVVEVLSPSNKTKGTPMHTAFMQKRATLMQSPVHWIEIDLLRAGERPNEVVGKSDYYVLLKRVSLKPLAVWYIDLRDRLPTILVPLRHPFPDATLDLQAALDTVYTRAHYADSVDYTTNIPLPPLRPANAQWIAARLQAWHVTRGHS